MDLEDGFENFSILFYSNAGSPNKAILFSGSLLDQ
jgi:hypothetical protein